MTQPRFFADAGAFGRWLEAHAGVATELHVGFHKVDSKVPSMTWPESVDEALCHGWIDGVRRRIDGQSYQIRFTPRKRSSIWSAVNIAKYQRLQALGRITPAGAQAFAHRRAEKSAVYAYEQEARAELSAHELQWFKQEGAAWTFFEATPPSYRQVLLHWVTTARRPETRLSRFATLLEACKVGKRLR